MRHTVIIGHSDEKEQGRLEGALEAADRFEVALATDDGLALLETALAKKPELIILELSLRTVDGLEVMRRLRAAGLESKCVVLLHSGGPLAEQAVEAGADRCVRIPYRLGSLTEQLRELAAPGPVFGRDEIAREVQAFWPQVNTLKNYKGKGFTEVGVYLHLLHPELINGRRSTKVFYPMIAEYCGLEKASPVERDIRIVIRHIWKSNPPETLRHFFGALADWNKRPPVSVFLPAVASYIKDELLRRRAETEEKWRRGEL